MLLLLRLLKRCNGGGGWRLTVLAELTVTHMSRTLLHMLRISQLRVPLWATRA